MLYFLGGFQNKKRERESARQIATAEQSTEAARLAKRGLHLMPKTSKLASGLVSSRAFPAALRLGPTAQLTPSRGYRVH